MSSARDSRRLTVDPARELATPFSVLAERHPAAGIAEGLGRLERAIEEHFPDNLFWDYDALVSVVAAERHDGPALAAAFDQVVELHALFGRHTAIRFRYVHDFVYGFDWARWVKRDPDRRAPVHPYSSRFRVRMLERGRELLDKIARDDATYSRLPDGAHRNPFGFSREPKDERRLYRDLARRGLLPIEAWRTDPTPVWDRPFKELRDERARILAR